MKYSIVMPHYRRAAQLANTLASFAWHYGTRTDWEALLIVDSKNDDGVASVIRQWERLPLRRVDFANPGFNPAVLFNAGAREARGDVVVLQNPECLHLSNVLNGLDAAFAEGPDSYVVCACASARRSSQFTRPDEFTYTLHMWYQHSIHRNVRYHFCSAVSRENYWRVGGFDERYAEGLCYDDDDFRDRVERAEIPFVLRDDLLVVHQEHEKAGASMPRDQYRRLLDRNRRLYESTRAVTNP